MRDSRLRTTPCQSGPNQRRRARLKAGAVTPGRPRSVPTPESVGVILSTQSEMAGGLSQSQ